MASDSGNSLPAKIPGIEGQQYVRGTQEHDYYKWQYATTSHAKDHNMDPALIIQPSNITDITLALKHAKSKRIAVAIRTGGHQYSGASSTLYPNIQLDLKKTFRDLEHDRSIFEEEGRPCVRTSVSWSLGEFQAYLKGNGLFVPHGQCSDVHLGGHVQTGGYGQLGRSFGLFGDHVTSLEIVDHEGVHQKINITTDPELFYAILGGSPGNFGVLTHFTIKVYRDSDYTGSRGMKALYWYNKDTLKRLLNILVEMSDDDDTLRNYDLCISVVSKSSKYLDSWPGLDGWMRKNHPEIYGQDNLAYWPRSIIVYAQWVPFSKNDHCDMAWFDRLAKGSIFESCNTWLGWLATKLPFDILGRHQVQQKPMSELTGDWLFRNVREFDLPYVKRTYVTNSTTLGRDDWAGWATSRIDQILKNDENKCYLSAQMQCFGGKYSKFRTNSGNGTSYSWRDTTVVCVFDCFHYPEAKEVAKQWQEINDREGIGRQGIFSKQDRRVLWGSYGNYDLNASWPFYYEDKKKYERLQNIRQAADPDGVFSPNPFCVMRPNQPDN